MRQYQLKNAKGQKGFTLVEILVVLGIIAIIGAAVFYFATTGRRGAEGDSAVRTSMSIMADAKSLKTGGVYADAIQQEYIDSGKAPDQIVAADDTTLVNDWGGVITMTAVPFGGSTINNAIELAYTQVPKQTCVDIALRIASSVLIVDVNGTVVKDADTPIESAAVIAACEATDPATLTLTNT